MDIRSLWRAPYKIRYMDLVLDHLLNSPKHTSAISNIHNSINVKSNQKIFEDSIKVGYVNLKSDIDLDVIIDDTYLRDVIDSLSSKKFVSVKNDTCKLLPEGILKITNYSFKSEYFHNKYDKTFKIFFGLTSLVSLGLGIYSTFCKD